jgi:hypothetical protein
MYKNKIFISIFLIIVLFSCKEDYYERPFEYINISSITENYPDNSKPFMNLRLAFTKTIANALEHYVFREYIIRTSKLNNENSFNEILFSLHYQDIIYNKKTLCDYINEAADNEVKSLYGNNFSDVILKQDPLGTIKIPDIFYDFNWEYKKYAPLFMQKQ